MLIIDSINVDESDRVQAKENLSTTQTVTGSAKVTSQTLEVKGDHLTAHSFLPPASFVLSLTSNVQICGPWAT